MSSSPDIPEVYLPAEDLNRNKVLAQRESFPVKEKTLCLAIDNKVAIGLPDLPIGRSLTPRVREQPGIEFSVPVLDVPPERDCMVVAAPVISDIRIYDDASLKDGWTDSNGVLVGREDPISIFSKTHNDYDLSAFDDANGMEYRYYSVSINGRLTSTTIQTMCPHPYLRRSPIPRNQVSQAIDATTLPGPYGELYAGAFNPEDGNVSRVPGYFYASAWHVGQHGSPAVEKQIIIYASVKVDFDGTNIRIASPLGDWNTPGFMAVSYVLFNKNDYPNYDPLPDTQYSGTDSLVVGDDPMTLIFYVYLSSNYAYPFFVLPGNSSTGASTSPYPYFKVTFTKGVPYTKTFVSPIEPTPPKTVQVFIPTLRRYEDAYKADYYASVNGTGDGLTKAEPISFETLVEQLATAPSPPGGQTTTVFVSEGVYRRNDGNAFNVLLNDPTSTDSLIVYGGFNSDFTERDVQTHRTILRGSDEKQVNPTTPIYNVGIGERVTLDGFFGEGCYLFGGTRSCVYSDCHADVTSDYYSGESGQRTYLLTIGTNYTGSSLRFTNCSFSGGTIDGSQAVVEGEDAVSGGSLGDSTSLSLYAGSWENCVFSLRAGDAADGIDLPAQNNGADGADGVDGDSGTDGENGQYAGYPYGSSWTAGSGGGSSVTVTGNLIRCSGSILAGNGGNGGRASTAGSGGRGGNGGKGTGTGTSTSPISGGSGGDGGSAGSVRPGGPGRSFFTATGDRLDSSELRLGAGNSGDPMSTEPVPSGRGGDGGDGGDVEGVGYCVGGNGGDGGFGEVGGNGGKGGNASSAGYSSYSFLSGGNGGNGGYGGTTGGRGGDGGTAANMSYTSPYDSYGLTVQSIGGDGGAGGSGDDYGGDGGNAGSGGSVSATVVRTSESGFPALAGGGSSSGGGRGGAGGNGYLTAGKGGMGGDAGTSNTTFSLDGAGFPFYSLGVNSTAGSGGAGGYSLTLEGGIGGPGGSAGNCTTSSNRGLVTPSFLSMHSTGGNGGNGGNGVPGGSGGVGGGSGTITGEDTAYGTQNGRSNCSTDDGTDGTAGTDVDPAPPRVYSYIPAFNVSFANLDYMDMYTLKQMTLETGAGGYTGISKRLLQTYLNGATLGINNGLGDRNGSRMHWHMPSLTITRNGRESPGTFWEPKGGYYSGVFGTYSTDDEDSFTPAVPTQLGDGVPACPDGSATDPLSGRLGEPGELDGDTGIQRGRYWE